MIKTKNKLHYRQIGKCQFRYKGTSKPFVESIYSIEAVKTEVLFTLLNQPYQREALLKYWSHLYLKYSHQYFEVCFRVLVLHLKNTSVLTTSTEYILSTQCSNVPLYIYIETYIFVYV